MNINYMECTCPNCGAKSKESCNTWGYGSPIRICKSCNHEYLDNRWREVAIEGFDPRSTNAGFYLKAMLILFVFSAVCLVLTLVMLKTKGYCPLKLYACDFFGPAAAVICGILCLRIKLGFEDKNNAVFMEESKKRLESELYIKKLEEYGYTIPDEYKKH